jgi:Flp pilus assembly protein TadG
MHRRTHPRAHRARRGAATVELALLLPFLAFIFVIGVDYSRVFYYSVTVTNCARNGAAYGCQDTGKAADQTGIQNAALADGSNLTAGQLSVSSTTDSSTYVEVTASYPFTTLTRYPGVPSSITLTRVIRMRVAPAVPTRYSN